MNQMVKELLNAYNPDTLEDLLLEVELEEPGAAPIENKKS
jgi:type I restriction enzyme, R subunit